MCPDGEGSWVGNLVRRLVVLARLNGEVTIPKRNQLAKMAISVIRIGNESSL